MSAFADGSVPISYASGLPGVAFDGMDCFYHNDSAPSVASAHGLRPSVGLKLQVKTRCPIWGASCSRLGYTSSGVNVDTASYPTPHNQKVKQISC